MPSILELFQSQPLPSQGGKTAEDAYAIQNSKDVSINVADPLVNSTGILLAKGARKLLGIRGSESLLEAETTGIRIIRNGAAPVIYGSEIDRLTLRTTTTLEEMRASNADISFTPTSALGSRIQSAADSVKSALGASVPITPSYVASQLMTNDDIVASRTQLRNIDLQTIKSSATGLPASKFLGELGGLLEGGNLKTIARTLAGNTLRLGKDKLREKLFGEGTQNLQLPPSYEDGVPILPNSTTTFEDGSARWLSPSVQYGSNSQALNPDSEPKDGVIFKGGSTYSNLNNINPSGDPGQRYDLSDKQKISLGYNPNDNQTKLTPSLYNLLPRELIKEYDIAGDYIPPSNNLSSGITFISTRDVPNEEDSLIIQEANKPENTFGKVELFIDREKFSSNPDRAPKFSQKVTRRDYSTSEFIENKYSFNSYSDDVNLKGVYSGTDTALDEKDFITLKMKSIVLGKSINFRSTITSLTETFSPSWEPSRFIGNPFSFYTYDSIERTVSFNFTVFSLSAKEHKVMWDKLNFLQSLVYPQGYYSTTAVKAPLVELTLGSMYSRKVSFIESLTFTTPDTSPWQTADTQDYVTSVDSGTGVRRISTTPENMRDYKLPHIVEVGIGFKFLESRSTTQGRKLYSFNPQTN